MYRGTVAQWCSGSDCKSKKVLGLNLLTKWGLHVLPGCSRFLPKTCRSTGYCKSLGGVNVSLNGCSSLRPCPQCYSTSHPKSARAPASP